jgi:choline dehydrogenase
LVSDFNYIIVGAGSAGCVLANRLTASGRHRVLLLEAGGEDRDIWLHIPIGYGRHFTNPKVNWLYQTEPEPECHDRQIMAPRGKVIGGSSSINGLLYVRGQREDFDHWRQLGNTGWSHDDVLPYFRKAEDNQNGASEFHGAGGPLRVSNQPYKWEIAEALLAACQQAGIPYTPDYNGATQEGCGYYQTTTTDKRRWSTAAAYLTAAKKRPNLTIKTRAHATRVLFEGKRAVGVEFRTPRGLETARAGREVIVSGGAYGSPQLLQLSGVGPAEHLRDMAVDVVHDLPGVGSNLQDHFNTYCTYQISRNLSLNSLHYSLTDRLIAGAKYVFLKSGPMSGNGMYVGALIRSDKRLERPDIQLNISAWSTIDRTRDGIISHPFPGISISPVHLRPDGRGSVRLRNNDPLAPPEIRFNVLKSDYDVQALIAGIHAARGIVRQQALRDLVVRETAPGEHVGSDEDMIADIRQRGVSNLHPVGSCGMGQGPQTVVDARLRVHGIAGLRVVDASVMPAIIAGNTNAPTIMIAEKASDMIQQDALAA